MNPEVLKTAPKSAAAQLRFENAQRATHLYHRSRSIRQVLISAAIAIAVARVLFGFGTVGETLSVPVVCAFALVAVLLALVQEWSSRVHQNDCLESYAEYLTSHRQLT